MRIIKGIGNNYSLTGLTLGELMAIKNALETAKLAGDISPVGEDVLYFLMQQDLFTLYK